MIRINILVCAGAAALGLAAHGPALAKPATNAAAADAVRAIEARWSADVKTRDPAKFARYYAPDATVMNPFSPVRHDRAGAEADMKAAYADPNFDLSFAPDAIGVAPGGAVAWAQGHFTQSGSDPKTHAKVTTRGSYLTIYKKDAAGAWQAIEDIATPGP
jgi:uncharacterized protein (TIGR02246 family)